LSRFRFNFGDDEIGLDRASVAAALAFDQTSAEAAGEALLPYLYAHDPDIVRRALRALGPLRPEMQSAINLAALAHHPDPSVRADLAQLLCWLPAPPMDLVERLAHDRHRQVRVKVALALWRLTQTNRDLAVRLRDRLTLDPSAHVRVAAAGLLDAPGS
jgi:hypothetical protein